MPSMYPPADPTVAGQNITTEQFLRNPERVQRVINDLTAERFIADHIFSSGGAAGGAVIFDQLSSSELYTERDAQAIEPGSEFPLTDSGEASPKVAAVVKWGAASAFTYEAVRRDSRDTLNRGLTKLRNTLIRKVDTVAMAALEAAPILGAAGSDWSNQTSGDIIGDLAVARSAIDDADMGYNADTVLINPAQYVDLMRNEKIRSALPREAAASNPAASGQLTGLMGFTWYVSNRVAAGSAYVLAAKVAGSIRDEMPLYSRTIDQQERERYLVQAARITVPIVTDPEAVYKLTGL